MKIAENNRNDVTLSRKSQVWWSGYFEAKKEILRENTQK